MKSGVSAHLPLPQRQIGVTASRAPLLGGLLATPLGASVWPLVLSGLAMHWPRLPPSDVSRMKNRPRTPGGPSTGTAMLS